MAVLKSPRNNRKKNIWTKSYIQSLNSKINIALTERKSPRIKHKYQVFLRDSAHWSVSASEESFRRSNVWLLPETENYDKPPVYVKYGNKEFNTGLVHPLIFRNHLNDKTECNGVRPMSERLFFILNSNVMIKMSKKKH